MAAFRLARLSPIAQDARLGGNTFPSLHVDMDHVFDSVLSLGLDVPAPALEREDREFLAGAQATQEQGHQGEVSHSGPRAWSSSSFSSFSSSGGGPAVQTSTDRVYDSDTGEVREVNRRSVGDQSVIEHRVHRDGDHLEAGTTRRLHNIDETEMEQFESHFSQPAGDHARLKPPKVAPVPPPAPPPISVSPEDLTVLRRVMPELSESEATELMRQHGGNLRAAMRAGLQQ